MIWTWQELAETDDETLSIKKETFQVDIQQLLIFHLWLVMSPL